MAADFGRSSIGLDASRRPWDIAYRRGSSRLRQLIGLSSTHSSYEAMVTSKWSKNPVSPSSPKEGIQGSQNQTGAVQP